MTQAIKRNKASQPKEAMTPVRRCAATGVTMSKERLLRFVHDPDGRVVFDVSGKLPGRGYYVIPWQVALAKAVKRRAFAIKAPTPITVPEGLAEQVCTALRQDMLKRLGLARRSGELVLGYENVSAALKKAQLSLLISASDASVHGEDKLERIATSDVPWVRCLRREDLSHAVGENNLVHLGVKSVIVARKFMLSALRYQAFVENWGADRLVLPYKEALNGNEKRQKDKHVRYEG